MQFDNEFDRAASFIESADGVLISAGAGMGVDSGLPDFRGDQGFWQAYPALADAGIEFASIANPYAFVRDPRKAWGFYGHRLRLYRETAPHEGFSILQRIAAALPSGAFVFTSNVDGQFQKAGFPEHQICEVHGSIHRIQCMEPCRDDIWPADYLRPTTDDAACKWLGELPVCVHCRCLARPNILMFEDWKWVAQRTDIQRTYMRGWLNSAKTLVVIELGAGPDIPTVRSFSQRQGAPLIRINPRHSVIPEGAGVSIATGALAGLHGIQKALQRRGFLRG